MASTKVSSFCLRIGTFAMLVLCLLVPRLVQAGDVQGESIAFYYGSHPPLNELAMFSQVVVEPEHLSKDDVRKLRDTGSHAIAYVSIGEVGRERSWYLEMKREWKIGENKVWNSAVMDMASNAWQEFLLERLIAPLSEKGFDGLFLDTLDSYRLISDDPKQHQVQEEGLVKFISRLHQRFPAMKLLLNRGFKIMDRVHDKVDGVVAESLFHSWDPAKQTYDAVQPDQQQWLQTTLEKIHDAYKLPVYVVDYVDPAQRKMARDIARKIKALGFVPWVANPALNMLGVGTLEVVPRKILVLYDSREAQLPYSDGHRYLAAPLEYMGYVIEYADIRAALPEGVLAGTYAGVISWITSGAISSRSVMAWLSRRMDEAVPVAFISSFGIRPSEEFLARLGLEAVTGNVKKPVRIVSRDGMAQMEASPRPLTRGMFPMRAVSADVQVHESIEDARHKRMDVIMTASWGGAALAPYVLEMGVDEHVRWRLDIFRFLKKALHLQPIPIFDTTTENGLRLLMAHIDGDGVASRAVMPGSPLAIRVIRDEILRKYRLPVTVSVIAGEFENNGLYPDRVAEMRKIARSIFAMDHVEIASHTYSHPFDWSKASSSSKMHLPLPGYTYSQESEISRSVRFIDESLAPPGKRTTVFLWSGDTLPDESAIRQVTTLGLRNMNGGDTFITRDSPSITEISGMARPVGDQLQVYSPVMNEAIYTNNWTQPLYGYRRVIETFELTDSPRRMKPIDIYYHFYSGSETASLKALKEVYDWSLKQPNMPVRVSEYVDKVQAYMQAVVARRMDGEWLLKAPDAIRTVRIPGSMGWPDMGRSSGVAGVADLPQGHYIHLAPSGHRIGVYTLRLSSRLKNSPYLVMANGRLEQWKVDGNQIRLQLQGHVPLHFSMSRPCTLRMGERNFEPEKQGKRYEFALSQKDTGHALLVCR